MAMKHSNICNYKTFQNFPQNGIFGFKINHLATLRWMRPFSSTMVFVFSIYAKGLRA
jgi:hypothetical protein